MKLITIEQALEKLQHGDVVAIPTETVYGLGGWIKSSEGLKKIFSTKERPFFDPLIVHIDSIHSAKKLTSNWTPVHEALAQVCWPGPLTLIAKKNDAIDPLITSGLDSVGLRCPRHPETLKLLALIDGGIAAPSANKFGKTSPTSSQHVFEEFGNDVSILEGGPSEIGIESTVAGISESDGEFTVEIYRPGYYTATMLEEILQSQGMKAQVIYAESPVGPGQLKHHYMPKIPLILLSPSFNWKESKTLIENELGKSFKNPAFWEQPQDANIASRELYQKLRQFDQDGYDLIITVKKPEHESEDWKGIWNRLSKAKTLEF